LRALSELDAIDSYQKTEKKMVSNQGRNQDFAKGGYENGKYL